MTSSSLRPVNRCTASLKEVILRSLSTVKTPIPRFSKSWLNCPCKMLVSDGGAFPGMALNSFVACSCSPATELESIEKNISRLRDQCCNLLQQIITHKSPKAKTRRRCNFRFLIVDGRLQNLKCHILSIYNLNSKIFLGALRDFSGL